MLFIIIRVRQHAKRLFENLSPNFDEDNLEIFRKRLKNFSNEIQILIEE
jgi:hypothetical protein